MHAFGLRKRRRSRNDSTLLRLKQFSAALHSTKNYSNLKTLLLGCQLKCAPGMMSYVRVEMQRHPIVKRRRMAHNGDAAIEDCHTSVGSKQKHRPAVRRGMQSRQSLKSRTDFCSSFCWPVHKDHAQETGEATCLSRNSSDRRRSGPRPHLAKFPSCGFT